MKIHLTVSKYGEVSHEIIVTPSEVGDNLFASVMLSGAAGVFPELHDFIIHISVDMAQDEKEP